MSNLAVDEKINGLIEDIEAIVVEKAYESQNAKLELFWLTGQALNDFVSDNGGKVTDVIKRIAADNRLSGKQMGERNLFWAKKIFEAFPDKCFPEEKAASLTKVKKLLGGEEKEELQPSAVDVAIKLVKKYGLKFAKEVAYEINIQSED